ncbi:MAG: hypothetical protein R3C60_11320 [Parvularculaceae bacterium]
MLKFTGFQVRWCFPLCFAAIIAVSAPARANETYRDYMAAAATAFESEDWAALDIALENAQQLRPYSLYVWKNRILAKILLGEKEEALALTKEIADRGLSMSMTGHAALEAFAASDAFSVIADRMKRNLRPIGMGTIVLNGRQADLLPEAVAPYPGKSILIGSVRSGAITAYDTAGGSNVLATAPGGVFDLEVRKNIVWAAVNNQLAYVKEKDAAPFAAVIGFDADTGDILHEFQIDGEESLFGDIEISKNGTIFASDSITPQIIWKAPKDQSLSQYLTDPRFVNLQGIALDERKKRLFVADYLAGLFVIDTKTKEVTNIANKTTGWLGGIDGLYYTKGCLLGVQNGTTPQRLVKACLNKRGTEIKSFEVLQQALSEWREPTHGFVVGNNLIYIATSNWPSYAEDGDVRDPESLKPILIMSTPIN